MLNKILAPLDGSTFAECAVPHLLAIAQVYSASVTLLRVLEPSRTEGVQYTDPLGWQISRTEAELYLDNLVASVQHAGLQAQKVLLEGSAAERIIEYAQTNEIDVVCLTDHGQGGLDPWGISSTTHKIIYSAPTSLMLIRATESVEDHVPSGHYQQILVPLDGSLRAESVLPIVISLASYHNSKIHLAHSVSSPEMARRTPPTPEEADLATQVVERNREEAAHYLEQIRSRLLAQNLEIEIHLVVAETNASALHDLAEQLGIDLVVINAHGYTGHAHFPYGSMVENLISYGKTSLLILQDFPNKGQPMQSEVAVRETPGH